MARNLPVTTLPSGLVAESYVTTRYMGRFSCIGPDCESSCCDGSWEVSVDQYAYKKLRRTMRRSGQQAQFHSKVERVEPFERGGVE